MCPTHADFLLQISNPSRNACRCLPYPLAKIPDSPPNERGRVHRSGVASSMKREPAFEPPGAHCLRDNRVKRAAVALSVLSGFLPFTASAAEDWTVVRDDRQQLSCVAESTGGAVVAADDASVLGSAGWPAAREREAAQDPDRILARPAGAAPELTLSDTPGQDDACFVYLDERTAAGRAIEGVRQ